MKKEAPGFPTSTYQLLSLVRSSLWQKKADESLFSENNVNWQEITRLALQQTVGVLAFEAALSLQADFSPAKDWRQKALSFIECNRRTHLLLDRCVAESISKLRDEGINAVLLKGQAYARAYPSAEMRQCGDIDLYVGVHGYLPAYTAAKKFGWESEELFLPKEKHYGCRLHGIRIELHRIAGQLPSRSTDNLFQKWSRIQLNESEAYLMVGGVRIMVPTPIFDLVFVFMHLYLHFLNGGIGLRHICDWTMLMHVHAGKINPAELERILNKFRLLRSWRKFAPIAVEHLGLPSAECPFYSPKHRGDAERILSLVMKEGNFGRSRQSGAKRPEGYLPGKLFSFRRYSLYRMKKLRIDPYAISRGYGSYVIKGITRIIKDLLKRN